MLDGGKEIENPMSSISDGISSPWKSKVEGEVMGSRPTDVCVITDNNKKKDRETVLLGLSI